MENDEIKKLAKLARIRLRDDELPKIAEKLARVVRYVSEIQSVKTEGNGRAEAGELRNIFREDGTPHETGAYTETILKNAPQLEKGYVKVKKIL